MVQFLSNCRVHFLGMDKGLSMVRNMGIFRIYHKVFIRLLHVLH